MEAADFDRLIEKLEAELGATESRWCKTVAELSGKLRVVELSKTTDFQAEVISMKQQVLEEVKTASYRIFKDLSRLRELQKEQFEFYTTGYKIAVKHSTDKRMLIDAALTRHQRKIDVYENHVEFLRETGKNLENMHYAIKNKVAIMNILGVD